MSFKNIVLFLVAFSYSSFALAADTIDAKPIVDAINGTKAPIISVIAAMLGILSIIVAYRMIRRVFG